MRRTLLVLLLLAACSGRGSTADTRADQVRRAATEAGLPAEVADVLALAARGADGTFQITYPGDDGVAVVVSQAPPNRRIDFVAGTSVTESRVFRDGVGYRCSPPDDQEGGPLECTRAQGALQAPGSFTAEALDAFAEQLAGSRTDIELSVESRTIADTDATCLVAAPRAGPTDGTGPGVETICLSAEGAQLLLDTDGERLVAEAYTEEVPDGTFEI